ncbi:unknown [Ruminococcus sp. CAG:382]|nr:unknown [Ruminococcus sp. CAG:382]
MQAGKPEAFGVFDYHERRFGDIHAHLHNGGGNEDIDTALLESGHDLLLFFARHFAVKQCHAAIRKGFFKRFQMFLGGFAVKGLVFLNERAYHIYPAARRYLLFDETVDAGTVGLVKGEGLDGLSSGRKLVYHGDIKVAVQYQTERSGNRGGGHYKRMR